MAGNSQLCSWCIHDSLIALWLAPARAKCWELSSQEKPEPALVWGSGNAVSGEDKHWTSVPVLKCDKRWKCRRPWRRVIGELAEPENSGTAAPGSDVKLRMEGCLGMNPVQRGEEGSVSAWEGTDKRIEKGQRQALLTSWKNVCYADTRQTGAWHELRNLTRKQSVQLTTSQRLCYPRDDEKKAVARFYQKNKCYF